MKKGQAALEFLATYGWAFLVILVMIGALAYFGVLDPSKYIAERCGFGTELPCEKDASLIVANYDQSTNYTLMLSLTNQLASGRSMNFTNETQVVATFDDPDINGGNAVTCFINTNASEFGTGYEPSVEVSEKKSISLPIICDNGLLTDTIGKKIKVEITLPYTVKGFESVTKKAMGELYLLVSAP